MKKEVVLGTQASIRSRPLRSFGIQSRVVRFYNARACNKYYREQEGTENHKITSSLACNAEGRVQSPGLCWPPHITGEKCKLQRGPALQLMAHLYAGEKSQIKSWSKYTKNNERHCKWMEVRQKKAKQCEKKKRTRQKLHTHWVTTAPLKYMECASRR